MTNETQISDFPARLKYLIGQSGRPNKVFAEECGIKEKQLYIYLRGESEPGMKALRGIKENFPNISIDWLVSGQGKPFLDSETGKADNVMGLHHERVIKEFDDKEFALEINQALVVLEKTAMKEFYKLGGYIKAMAEQGVVSVADRRKGERRQDNELYAGEERRSGKERRKAVGGG